MQKRFRLPLLSAAVVVVLFASCGKTNKQGLLVPKNAAMVLHINGESLNSKLPWDEIKKNELFKDLNADSTMPPFIRNIIDNPDNSGVDTKTDIIAYGIKDSSGAYFAIEGTVKDAAKFNTFNTMVTGGGSSMEKDGINFISKAPMCVGWTKDKFVYVIDMPKFANMSYLPGRNDMDRMPRDLGATCRAVFALKEDNSLGKDDKFSTLMADKADAHFWMNSDALMSGSDMMGILGMTKIGDLYKDAISTASLSFDNGKINIDFKSYAGKMLADIFRKYEGGEINTDMFKRFGGKNVAGAFALNFKPGVIKELLTATGTDGFANNWSSKYGVSVDDFIKANKGDIFIAASDITMKNDTVRYGTEPGNFYVDNTPNAKFIFAVSIDDKAAFNNLIKAAQKMTQRTYVDSSAKPNPVSFSTNDKYFAIGNDKALVDQYIAGGNNDFDFLKNISGNPAGGYINIQTIMKAFQGGMKDSMTQQIFNASLQLWQDAYIKGGKIQDGGMTQHVEINLVDKNTNSLKQLNTYFAKIAQLEKEQQKKQEALYKQQTLQEERIDTTMRISPARPNGQ